MCPLPACSRRRSPTPATHPVKAPQGVGCVLWLRACEGCTTTFQHHPIVPTSALRPRVVGWASLPRPWCMLRRLCVATVTCGGRRREATHVLLDSFFFKHRRACPVCTVLNACFGLSLRGARRAAAAAYKIASAWRAGVRARACAYTEYSKEFIITYPVEILSVPLCHFSKLRENVPKR